MFLSFAEQPSECTFSSCSASCGCLVFISGTWSVFFQPPPLTPSLLHFHTFTSYSHSPTFFSPPQYNRSLLLPWKRFCHPAQSLQGKVHSKQKPELETQSALGVIPGLQKPAVHDDAGAPTFKTWLRCNVLSVTSNSRLRCDYGAWSRFMNSELHMVEFAGLAQRQTFNKQGCAFF